MCPAQVVVVLGSVTKSTFFFHTLGLEMRKLWLWMQERRTSFDRRAQGMGISGHQFLDAGVQLASLAC
jgi:hypothetical protein